MAQHKAVLVTLQEQRDGAERELAARVCARLWLHVCTADQQGSPAALEELVKENGVLRGAIRDMRKEMERASASAVRRHHFPDFAGV